MWLWKVLEGEGVVVWKVLEGEGMWLCGRFFRSYEGENWRCGAMEVGRFVFWGYLRL